MGLLEWLSKLGSTPAATPAFHWPPPSDKERRDGTCEADDFGVDVVGESHYQSAIVAVAHEEKITAVLIPETDNPHDPKAVRVEINRQTVGYLSRDDAMSFRRRLARRKLGMVATSCEASIAGGFKMRNGKQASYGVSLDIKQFD